MINKNNKTILLLTITILLSACNNSPKVDQNNSHPNSQVAEEDEEPNIETVATTLTKKSSNQPKSNETDKYTGNYTSQDEACDIKVSVKKSDLLYSYQFTTATLKNSGNLKIDTVKNNVYFRFTNLNSESEGYAIKAQVNDDELIIQNYGNAMNQYHHIKDCDVKYINLAKEK
tara:strand:+ start:17 stop:535 length:519 start_codon:yes stop_codon:yes gene_type:complete